MNNESNKNQENNQENNFINSIPSNFMLVEKNIFNCICCYEMKEDLLETECCGTFICSYCQGILNSNKCPICKIYTKIKPSKIAKRIYNNAITKCKICDFSNPYEKLKVHYKNEHLKSEKDLDLIIENLELFNIFISILSIPSQIKLKIHSHNLYLTRDKINECKGESFYQNPDCNFNIQSNESNNENNKNKNNNSKDFSKEIFPKFFKKLFYKCKTCEFAICFDCKEINEVSFMTFAHDHPLDLNPKDSFWICNSSYEENNCLMGVDSIEKSHGMTRFTCLECDYDLCELCIDKHLMK